MQDKQKIEELKELSLPLINFIRENYHPHTKIVITDTGVELMTVELGCPVPVDINITLNK